MGGKSLKRQWSAEEIEKRLSQKQEQPKSKNLVDMFREDEEA